MMAVSQPKHVAYKLTAEYCQIVDFICCVFKTAINITALLEHKGVARIKY
jgi:hypothetical protein